MPLISSDSYQDSTLLIRSLVDCCREGVPVPDSLMQRLAELNDQPAILAMLRDKAMPCEARMCAVELLQALDSHAPMVDYLRWQVERDEPAALLDGALESLRAMGAEVQRPAKMAFLAADDVGKEALLDVLVDFPSEDDIFHFALQQFKQQPQKCALYAGYLGKLNDDRALEPLLLAAEKADISYIDFMEVRNAIERLGGEAPIRDFSKDPTYALIKRCQRGKKTKN